MREIMQRNAEKCRDVSVTGVWVVMVAAFDEMD
jgi:hypothetical protein